mgnify:CR=1 FL=1
MSGTKRLFMMSQRASELNAEGKVFDEIVTIIADDQQGATPASDEFNREKLGPAKAVYYSVKEIWFVCKTTIQFIGSLFQGKGDTSQLGGPIKIAQISGQVDDIGFFPLLNLIAYISISI